MKHSLSTIRKPIWWASLLVLVMIVLAACSPAATPAPTATAMPPAATATSAPTMAATVAPTTASAASGPAEVDIATDAKLGKILVDSKGMTLYAFTKDAPDKSNCSGGCLKAWPPLLSADAPKAGAGVDASMLGTTTMADGSKIVTYNHMPLYYWAKDQKPGDTTGQDVNKVWYVVSPYGKLVGAASVPQTGANSTPAATAAATTMANMGPVTINVATDPTLGKILVDGKGMTLYMFKKDTTPDTSNCTGGCLKAWPPLQGTATAGAGVDASKIGTGKMADGSSIITYNHMPLYYFAKDQKPGDVTGQGVGGVWYVLSPAGDVITTPAGSSSSSGAAPAASGAMLNVATDAKLGKILVDGKGMTLYMFKKDTPDTSNCTGGCLKAWPPFVGPATAGTGVDASKIGTATLADGTKIVTYNHMPLYYWAGDKSQGDTTGQGVQGVWYVVAPDGNPVTTGSTGY